MIKYPIEIEITDFCSLKCKNCINPLLKNKGFISISMFDSILDYIYKNIENISYLNLSWIWDIFLHKDIKIIFEKILEKFAFTNINILIPTKWNIFCEENIVILKKMQNSWININVSIWIYSINEKINNYFLWVKSHHKILKFILLCKKNNVNFSIELLNNFISKSEKKIFKNFVKKIGVWWKISNYHNFWWNLEIDFKLWKNKCDFSWENYKIKDSFCSFIPMISKDGKIYTCSISWKNKNFLVWDFYHLIKKYENYIDLVFFIKNNFVNSKNCSKCSIFLNYYA